MSKLFAVGFPRDFDELQLAQLFAPYGDIELLTIVRDRTNGESKGYGFIHMKTETGAGAAIQALNGHPFGDRQMEVRLADEKPVPVRRPVTKPKYVPVRPGGENPLKKKRPRLSR
jgi:RNA recognition motif-containing protein